MGYVGNPSTNLFTSMDKQDITGNGGAIYTLSHAVANANEIEVYVNNVRQEPNVAYTTNGTALNMTGNVASSDDFYVVYQGKAVGAIVPPDGSVGTAKIADGSVTTAKLDNNAVTSAKLAATIAPTNLETTSSTFKMTDLTSNAFYRTGTFTPTFNPFTVGNGSVFGNYIRIGDLVHVNLGFEFGSTSSIGGDIYNISGLPFAAAENISGGTVSYIPIPFICWDNGAAWRQGVGQIQEGANYIVYPAITATANLYVNASTPFTWATGDSLTFTGTYTTDAA